MAEYIERAEAIKFIKKHLEEVNGVVSKENVPSYFYDMAKRHAIDYLGIVPAADVVEVVRCKDCKYWQRNTGVFDSPNGLCSQWSDVLNGYDFCSYGERRSEEC